MIEKALTYELEQRIPELRDNIFPVDAPEEATKPYLVYIVTDTNYDKNYNGFTGHKAVSFVFSCMSKKYEVMSSLADKVEEFLQSIINSEIGDITDSIYVINIIINNRTFKKEYELGVYRGIIDFTIVF